MKVKEDSTRPWSIFRIADRIQTWVDVRLQRFIDRQFASAMTAATKQPYVFCAAVVAVFIVCIGLVAGGRIGFVLFPKMDSDLVQAKVVFLAERESKPPKQR